MFYTVEVQLSRHYSGVLLLLLWWCCGGGVGGLTPGLLLIQRELGNAFQVCTSSAKLTSRCTDTVFTDKRPKHQREQKRQKKKRFQKKKTKQNIISTQENHSSCFLLINASRRNNPEFLDVIESVAFHLSPVRL